MIKTKLHKAGIKEGHADVVADVFDFADARGIHSHRAIRMGYYSERIAKGGINTNPFFPRLVKNKKWTTNSIPFIICVKFVFLLN